MKKIVIIGAGQLGSRHLQGISQSPIDISIEVVDPVKESIKIAKERYQAVINKPFVKEISFYNSIDKLSNNIDMAIVATSADVRAKVAEELLTKKSVSNLILEKVLFQCIKDYYLIEKLLEKTNTKCWINHPRRMFPYYKKLKSQFKNANQVSFSIQGGNWGLACNGLHFIDLFSYLTGSNDLLLNYDFLDKVIYDSKRAGFIEFNGLLVGKLSNHSFSLSCNREYAPIVFNIISDEIIAKIDESKGEINIATKKKIWEWEIINEKIAFFQSELSNMLIEDILIKNDCSLPTYLEAMKLHIPYIQCLLDHMNEVTRKKHNRCPIT